MEDVPRPEACAGAAFLLCGGDYGPAAAPATAVEWLLAAGIRAVVAPGFERGFYERCFDDGLLPAMLTTAGLEALARHLAAHPGAPLTIDLEGQTIDCEGMETMRFEVDPRGRNKLLLGLSDLDEMLRHARTASELRSDDRKRRPWLYEPE